MKNFNIKLKVLSLAVSLCAFTSCDQENDELAIENEVAVIDESDLSSKGTCNPDTFKLIDAISGTDYNSSINTQIDDRSCSYDYVQTKLGTSHNWGRYRLRSSDNTGRLQVRMERSSKRLNFSNNKTLKLTSNVRILNAGFVNNSGNSSSLGNKDGTYIAQVKGKHDRIVGNESADPAIILFIAKPRRHNNGNGSVIRDGNGKIKEFNIYAERVKQRGGSSSGGRELKLVTRVRRNKDFKISITSEFFTKNNIKQQKIIYTINGSTTTFNVPTKNTSGQTTVPLETRIRIGAYRCRGGEADILYRDNLRLQ
jgi:hypothetical protein